MFTILSSSNLAFKHSNISDKLTVHWLGIYIIPSHEIFLKTRSISIESQPKKVVDVVVVVIVFVVGVCVVVVIVGHRNLTLKFGQNWVNNKSYIVVVVVVIVLALLLLLIQKPIFKTLSKSGH